MDEVKRLNARCVHNSFCSSKPSEEEKEEKAPFVPKKPMKIGSLPTGRTRPSLFEKNDSHDQSSSDENSSNYETIENINSFHYGNDADSLESCSDDGDDTAVESLLISKLKEIQTLLDAEEIENALWKHQFLLQMDFDDLNGVSSDTFYDLLNLLDKLDLRFYLSPKLETLKLCFKLSSATYNKKQKQIQMKHCAEKAFTMARKMIKSVEMKKSIESDLLPVLKKWCKPVYSTDQPLEVKHKAWCLFYLGSCYIYCDKYGMAKETVKKTVLVLKQIFGDDACKLPVLASLYLLKAEAHKYAKQQDRAIRYFKS